MAFLNTKYNTKEGFLMDTQEQKCAQRGERLP